MMPMTTVQACVAAPGLQHDRIFIVYAHGVPACHARRHGFPVRLPTRFPCPDSTTIRTIACFPTGAFSTITLKRDSFVEFLHNTLIEAAPLLASQRLREPPDSGPWASPHTSGSGNDDLIMIRL